MVRSFVFITMSLTVIFLTFDRSAWAVNVRALNSKTDELELEKEIEDMEKYGEAAGQVESDREMTRLTQETRRLEREINRSRRMNESALKKTKRLAGLYQKKARLAAAVQLQANRAEARRNKAEKIVARLDSKVKMKESAAIQAVQRRKDAEADYVQLMQDEKILKRRLRVADETIKRNNQKRKLLRAKSIKMTRTNNTLKSKLAKVEVQAMQL